MSRRTVFLFRIIILSLLFSEYVPAQTTLSTLNFADPHVGSALTTDDYGFVADFRVGTKDGDVYTEVQWVDYLTKFVILNGGTPIEIKNGTVNLGLWDNNPAAPVADGYFIPARFEDWSYDAVNSPAVWHSVIEYENGGDHVIGAVAYKLLDPSPTLGFPYAELNPAYQFTNVGAANATLRTIHYERNAQSGNTVYSNHGGGQWDYDNTDGTSDDFVAVSSPASSQPYVSFAGFPLERYRVQDSSADLLNDLQTAAANYNLANGTNPVLGATPEISYQVAEITLAPGEAVIYWLYPKPIKIVNTAQEYPTDIDYEKKSANTTGVDYAFANTDVSINYSGLNYTTNGAGATATFMEVTVAEITGGIVASDVSGGLDHVSTIRYWEIFYDTRRLSTVGDFTFTYDPPTDGIDDESTLTLAYRTDYAQDWTEWAGVVQDQDDNTLTAISVNLDDSQWIIASTNGSNPLPVELTSFSANIVAQDILLTWSTASESGNYGFEVEQSQDSRAWNGIGFVAGQGTKSTPTNYSFTVTKISGGTHFFRLKQIDQDGTLEYSGETEVNVGVPAQFELLQNYPNPFNPSTRIRYRLPQASHVSLIIYDLTGREIRRLLDESKPAGEHSIEWNGKSDGGRSVAGGLYFYKIQAGSNHAIGKMMYIR